MPEKQPVIQSVFDRHMANKNNAFFQMTIREIEQIHRDILLATEPLPGVSASMLRLSPDDQKEILIGLRAAVGILRGIENAMDVLVDDGVF